jgi:hypothetical protein
LFVTQEHEGDIVMWQANAKSRWRGACAAAVMTCATLAHADATTGTFSVKTTLSAPCAVFAVATSPTTTRLNYGEPSAFSIDGSSTDGGSSTSAAA